MIERCGNGGSGGEGVEFGGEACLGPNKGIGVVPPPACLYVNISKIWLAWRVPPRSICTNDLSAFSGHSEWHSRGTEP